VYETYGTLNEAKDNVVVVCHALTGSHHAAGTYEDETKAGWWDALIGPQKAIDTDKFFVICANTIGSCFGSTGPMSPNYPSSKPYRYKFPVVSIEDMVKAQKILFASLGIHEVHAIVGGSMGGMQALVFSIIYPDFAKHVIALATTYATQPWAIAFNKVAQEAILKDADFKSGYYESADIQEKGLAGMAVGRMAGHISFLSNESMATKFGREYKRTDGLYELFGKFQVESYLEYNGYNFTKWFDPLSYLYITKAINIFDLARGWDSLEESLCRIKTDLHLISFRADKLFYPSEMSTIEETMTKNNQLCHHLKVDSSYGHDAFLVELDTFDFYITEILEGSN